MILKCTQCSNILTFSFKDSVFLVDRCSCSSKWDTYMGGLNARVEECISRLNERYCWYRLETNSPLVRGIFHGWGSVSKPANKDGTALVQDSTGLVEDNFGRMYDVPTTQIQFRKPPEQS